MKKSILLVFLLVLFMVLPKLRSVKNSEFQIHYEYVSKIQFPIGAFVGSIPTEVAYEIVQPAESKTVVNLGPYPTDEMLRKLRVCESGGRYDRQGTWDGYPSKYSGAYQFDQLTWNGIAQRYDSELYNVLPAYASPEEQDQFARWLWNERGSQPWPECGRGI